MKTYIFAAELRLPRPPAEVFSFFGEARNLEFLTPPWLRFEVLTPAPIVIRAGTLINGFPVRWQTEIIEWNPPHRFVDMRGPYAYWHHTLTFEEHDGRTKCVDQVQYRPRGGALINWLSATWKEYLPVGTSGLSKHSPKGIWRCWH